MKRNYATYTCLFFLVIAALAVAPQDVFGQQNQPAADNYADLGNPEDEKFHELRGWSGLNAVLPEGLALDRTSRYQSLRGPNSVKLFVQQLGTPYKLTVRSEAGLCDDSFEVYVNDTGPLYVYRNKEASPLKTFHQITLDPSVINDTTVEVSFRNIAEDACGRAAIGFVSLEPLVGTPGQQQASPRLGLKRAVEVAELFADREKIDLTAYDLTEAKIVRGQEGEPHWRLRWHDSTTKLEKYMEFTVSMDGIVSYRLAR